MAEKRQLLSICCVFYWKYGKGVRVEGWNAEVGLNHLQITEISIGMEAVTAKEPGRRGLVCKRSGNITSR